MSLLLGGLLATSATPLGTVRAYFEALARGDADGALALVDEPSEADRLVVEASAASEGGLRRLEELVRDRFGERVGLGVAERHRQWMQALEKAKVEVHADRAVVRPEGERPVRLRHVNGAWKVESPAERISRAERNALELALRKTEEATKDLAARIRSGACKSARDAREALRKALGGNEQEGTPL